MSALATRGWQSFPADRRIRSWIAAAHKRATDLVADPAHGHWLRCGGTWFAGVNLLSNAPDGAMGGVPLGGAALDYLGDNGMLPDAWDKAQISVVYPGYPRRSLNETAAAFRFRHARDAAHVDGLLPIGPDRRRMLREAHGFVLGVPLSQADPEASPLVVWEGSHRIMQQAFREALQKHAPETWPDIDLTAVYHAARKHCFETCRRVPVIVAPGGAYLVHRMALHGVAPWKAGAAADPDGRMIAYFRPDIPMENWLSDP